MSGLIDCGTSTAAGPYGNTRVESKISGLCSKARGASLVFPTPSHDRLPLPASDLLACPTVPHQLLPPSSGDKDGYAVGFVPCHQRPGDARHPAGEGHGDQHARLARQHSGQPRVLRAAPPGRPSPSRRRSTGAGDRGDPSSISSRASASRRSNSGGEPSPARLRSPGRTGSSPTTARRPGSPSPSTIRSPACSSAASSARLHAPAHAVPAPSPRFSRRVRQSERRTARPAPEPGPQPRIGIVNCLRQPPAAARGRYRHRQGNGQSPVRPAR